MRANVTELQEAWRSRLDDRWPLQYLTSSSYWRDLVLFVGHGVLIPRPETEQLIDMALDTCYERRQVTNEESIWVDLGTGNSLVSLRCECYNTINAYSTCICNTECNGLP